MACRGPRKAVELSQGNNGAKERHGGRASHIKTGKANLPSNQPLERTPPRCALRRRSTAR
jgi:hypothetical protein